MIKPEIENYFDYREYLKDLFLWHKSDKKIFSHRYIVQKAGYKSPTALKDVIDKKKNLTITSAERFADAFKMTESEKSYFLLLLKFNTAETVSQKDSFFSELTLLRNNSSHRKIEMDEFEILDNWWTLAIREALSLPDYKHSKKWLSRVLDPQISEEEVASSMEILKKSGMIEKVDGQWHCCDAVIKTDKNLQSVKVARYHEQMINLAKRALKEAPSSLREISGTTVRIPLNRVEEIKNRIYNLRQAILLMAENSLDADQVFQLNFQLFPLVKTDRAERMGKQTKGRKE